MNKNKIKEFEAHFQEQGFLFKNNFQWIFDKIIGYNICHFCKHNIVGGPHSHYEEGRTFCYEFGPTIRMRELKYQLKSCGKYVSNQKNMQLPSRIKHLTKFAFWILLLLGIPLFLVLSEGTIVEDIFNWIFFAVGILLFSIFFLISK